MHYLVESRRGTLCGAPDIEAELSCLLLDAFEHASALLERQGKEFLDLSSRQQHLLLEMQLDRGLERTPMFLEAVLAGVYGS